MPPATAASHLHVADGDDLGLPDRAAAVEWYVLALADGRLWVVSALIGFGEPGDALESLAEVEPQQSRYW